MPVIKFDSVSTHNSNCGSSFLYTNYLLKEDTMKPIKEFFFNNKRPYVAANEVISSIDGMSKQGLRKTDAKFFTGSINFSESELKHLGNDFEKIKDFTRNVFDIYRKQHSKHIDRGDVNWYAKIEEYRYFDGKNGNKQGELKPGLHTHVHFIVARKTFSGLKISPKTNHRSNSGIIKGSFDRSDFFNKCEKQFDAQFSYIRPFHESYKYRNTFKNGTLNHRLQALKTDTSAKLANSSYSTLNNEQKLKAIEKLALYMQYGISKDKKFIDIDIPRLQAFEKASDYKGGIYNSLLKLNFQLKLGNVIYNGDITQMIIDDAKKSIEQKAFPNKSQDIAVVPPTINEQNNKPSIAKDFIVNFNESAKMDLHSQAYREEPKKKRKKGRRMH